MPSRTVLSKKTHLNKAEVFCLEVLNNPERAQDPGPNFQGVLLFF